MKPEPSFAATTARAALMLAPCQPQKQIGPQRRSTPLRCQVGQNNWPLGLSSTGRSLNWSLAWATENCQTLTALMVHEVILSSFPCTMQHQGGMPVLLLTVSVLSDMTVAAGGDCRGSKPSARHHGTPGKAERSDSDGPQARATNHWRCKPHQSDTHEPCWKCSEIHRAWPSDHLCCTL